ncbi:MAG: phosphonoacetaldehyde hydrolase [Pirellulaceae bacterium]
MAEKPMDVKAVLFDWAGTTVDFGSRAPAKVFQEIFRQRGVEITEAEAREPMGRAKRDHISQITRMPRVAAAWDEHFGRSPTDQDVQDMYDEFLPLQKRVLAQHSEVIAGVSEAVAELRARGLRIGSSTGYTRELMDVVLPLAADQGYSPDVCVCSDDVAAGRPAPWMNYRAAEWLGVYPMDTIVVVDDTPIGIVAGRHAGMWTIAVSRTGNSLGLSAAEVAALPDEELEGRLRRIEADFYRAGAHLVIGGVDELPDRLHELGRLRNRSEMPT